MWLAVLAYYSVGIPKWKVTFAVISQTEKISLSTFLQFRLKIYINCTKQHHHNLIWSNKKYACFIIPTIIALVFAKTIYKTDVSSFPAACWDVILNRNFLPQLPFRSNDADFFQAQSLNEDLLLWSEQRERKLYLPSVFYRLK